MAIWPLFVTSQFLESGLSLRLFSSFARSMMPTPCSHSGLLMLFSVVDVLFQVFRQKASRPNIFLTTQDNKSARTAHRAYGKTFSKVCPLCTQDDRLWCVDDSSPLFLTFDVGAHPLHDLLPLSACWSTLLLLPRFPSWLLGLHRRFSILQPPKR